MVSATTVLWFSRLVQVFHSERSFQRGASGGWWLLVSGDDTPGTAIAGPWVPIASLIAAGTSNWLFFFFFLNRMEVWKTTITAYVTSPKLMLSTAISNARNFLYVSCKMTVWALLWEQVCDVVSKMNICISYGRSVTILSTSVTIHSNFFHILLPALHFWNTFSFFTFSQWNVLNKIIHF